MRPKRHRVLAMPPEPDFARERTRPWKFASLALAAAALFDGAAVRHEKGRPR